nr:Suppressor of fused protein (SUFU) [Streptococcus thermophilus]
MVWRRRFFSRERVNKRTGSEYLLDHLATLAGANPVAVHGELEFSDDVAVLIYRFDQPVPHYLYVTHGISRTNSSQPVAGIQTELSLRVPLAQEPPTWPVHRLRGLATYLRKSGDPIEPGHYMDLRSPVCRGATLSAFIFVNDPILELSIAPTGWVRFIYAVAVTADELEAALRWDPLKFAGVLGDRIPLGLSDPRRSSLLVDASSLPLITSKTEAEGSSISAVSSSYFAVDESGRIDLSTHAAADVLRAMRWRLGYGKSFAVMGAGNGTEAWVRFLPDEDAESSSVTFSRDSPGKQRRTQEPLLSAHITVEVNRALRHEILAVLEAEPGTYRMRSAPLSFCVIDPKR